MYGMAAGHTATVVYLAWRFVGWSLSESPFCDVAKGPNFDNKKCDHPNVL